MLSVIVPTRDRARLLRLALQSLSAQTISHDEFEVIVVDNGSTDNTKEVVEAFRQQFGDVHYVFDPTPGLHVGRHCGLRAARGNVLVYADDDIQATPTWLQAIQECFRDPVVALVGGNNYPNFENTPPSWLQKLWHVRSYGGKAITSLSILELPAGRRAVDPFFVWGCNFSIRKHVLLEAGGFHPDSVPEECIRFRGDGETHVSASIFRRRLTCLFDSGASVYHTVAKERMTFQYFRKRAFGQGISDSYTYLRNGGGEHLAPKNTVGGVRAAAKRIYRRAGSLLQKDRELRELDHVIHAAYREGYAYHQKVYRDDPDVRAWVHKPDYF